MSELRNAGLAIRRRIAELEAALERAERELFVANETLGSDEDSESWISLRRRAQKAEAVVEELRGVAGGVIWLDNNIDKYGTQEWRGFFKATLRDARRGYALAALDEETA